MKLKDLSILVIVLLIFCSCQLTEERKQHRLYYEHLMDSLGEAKIDSAYKSTQAACADRWQTEQSRLQDSLIKSDTIK
jgi:hypothetical protein